MPTVRAADYPYQPYATQQPSTTVPTAYQDIRTPIGAFGGATGEALSQLGATFEKANDRLASVALERQDLQNRIVADQQISSFENNINKVMYGDPDKPGDVGYMGLKGQDALDQRGPTRVKIDQILQEHQAVLQNPHQRLAFDTQSRRYRNYVLNDVGRHYDSEFNRWGTEVTTGRAAVALGNAGIAANNDDFDGWKSAFGTGRAALQEGLKGLGHPPEYIDAKLKDFDEKAVEDWAKKLATRDPVKANQFIDYNSEYLPSKYDDLKKLVKTQADKAMATEIATGAKAPRGTPDLVRGGAVQGHLNYGGTGALGDPRSPGWDTQNLTTVTSSSGANFKVNKAAATDIKGFLSELEGAGYKIDPKESGGHNLREMTDAKGQLSEHAYGTAFDINPSRNPYSKTGQRITDLPANVAEIAAKYNLEWGGSWNDPIDPMHFQWRGPRNAQQDNNFGGIRRQGVTATRAEGGFERYDTPEQGVQAVSEKLRQYAAGGIVTATNPSGKPLNTLSDIISVWAPPNENNTPLLISNAAKVTGFTPDQVLDMRDPATITKVTEAIIRGEHGGALPVSQSMVKQAAATVPIAGSVDQLIKNLPEKEPGEIPDADLGVAYRQSLEAAAKRAIAAGAPISVWQGAVKMLRQQYNAAYVDQQRQERMVLQEQHKKDETIKDGFLRRMDPDADNPPTVGEILRSDMSTAAKENTIGFLTARAQPGPTPRVSASNQTDLFARIHAGDDTENKIRSEDPINLAYKEKKITWEARKELINDFRDTYTSTKAEWAKAEADVIKAAQPKIRPTLSIKDGHLIEQFQDPEGPDREVRFKRFVDQQIKDTVQAGKDPNKTVLNPDSPEYVGKQLDRFTKGGPSLFNKVNEGAGKQSFKEPTSMGELQAQWKAGRWGVATSEEARQAAYAEAIRRGFIQPSLQPPVR